MNMTFSQDSKFEATIAGPNTVVVGSSSSECVNCGHNYFSRYGNSCPGCNTQLLFTVTRSFKIGDTFADTKAHIESIFPGLTYVGLGDGLTGGGGEEFYFFPQGANGELHC